jgi:hypothetical protein
VGASGLARVEAEGDVEEHGADRGAQAAALAGGEIADVDGEAEVGEEGVDGAVGQELLFSTRNMSKPRPGLM